MHGSNNPIVADVTDAGNPRTICTLTGSWQPQLVTQTSVSWSAIQGSPGLPGPSMIVVLDLFTGTSTIAASWQGGGFMDGLQAWSPDHSFLAYLTSDASAVNIHLFSGGGDRVVASLGAVPGRGVNPIEDDAYIGFSADGAYFALVQTFTGSGDQMQIRRTTDGSLVYSQAAGTMATWSSTGSRLYFRKPSSSEVDQWDPTSGVSRAFGQAAAWIRPRADSGDDYLAFTVRDAAGTPRVWTYGHSGRAGGTLPNVRSSPVWLNATTFFYVEEAACGSACGIGPAWQPDGHTFTYDISKQAEDVSRIGQVYGTWPQPGQT
jgi:Tol biopolymer transport system component